jgi:hypothetical protein
MSTAMLNALRADLVKVLFMLKRTEKKWRSNLDKYRLAA